MQIPQYSRRQGLYIIGATGTSKTGLIENRIMQDAQQGLGVGRVSLHLPSLHLSDEMQGWQTVSHHGSNEATKARF